MIFSKRTAFPKKEPETSEVQLTKSSYDNEKHHTRVLVKILQEIVCKFSGHFCGTPLEISFDQTIGPQHLLAEMLQFDRLGFLFQGANLKIHTDGTNVTLLEGAKGWIPGRWGEMASKSLGKNRKGGRQLREDLARDIGWCIDMY